MRTAIHKSLQYCLLFAACCILLSMLASCEKAETPVVLPARPNDSVSMSTADLGSDYGKQVFVDLKNKKMVSVDQKSWDLSFDSHTDGNSVFINGGNSVLIASTGSVHFSNNIIQADMLWRWDEACGLQDSLALSKWINRSSGVSGDSVYVIDRGPDCEGPRYYQFKIRSVNSSGYVLRLAEMDGSNEHDFLVSKDPQKTNVYFSFSNGGTWLNFEPPKDQWQFCFLRYRWIYYEFNPPLLYNVTGIFINTSFVNVAVDSSMGFYAITPSQCQGQQYSGKRDIMGFDWKVYNFAAGKYKARNFVNYLIKEHNASNMVYKLRFVDFYGSKGEKGMPKFEFQRVWW